MGLPKYRSKELDRNELVKVYYEGYIVAISDPAVGFSFDAVDDKPLWIAKKLLGNVRYANGVVTTEFHKGGVTGFRCARWKAREQRLIGGNE